MDIAGECPPPLVGLIRRSRSIALQIPLSWVRRSILVLLLTSGWFWQQRQHVSVVAAFMTTTQARSGAAQPISVYRTRAPWVCVYLVYNDARPGSDTYTVRFSRGPATFFQDNAHQVPVRHGAALNCYATGGNLGTGHYTATVVLNGKAARRIPFSVEPPATVH